MSKVGNKANKTFNPIITDISYDKLNELKNLNKTAIPNALIISVPQDTNGNDIDGEASIWMSDENGYLFNISMPNNKLLINKQIEVH